MSTKKILFSQTTNGFYDTTLNYSAIPPDAVEITAAQHKALLDAQRLGERITSDPQGHPIAVPRET